MFSQPTTDKKHMLKRKFRGQKNSTKEWIYGSLISDKDNGYAIVQQTYNPVSNGQITGWCFGIVKGTEGQYTGLNDVNDKEIYEGCKAKVMLPMGGFWGDVKTEKIGIVKWSDDRCRFVVEWDWSKNHHHIDLDCDLDIEIIE